MALCQRESARRTWVESCSDQGVMIVNTETPMKSDTSERHSDFLKSLVEFTKDHRAARWSGTLAEFLETIFPADPKGITRSSHQYIWDMLRANGFDDVNSQFRCQLFEDELFGIDDTIARIVDYFKAASAGSEVTDA